jgi:biotin synthesis protein BioG
MTGWGCDDIQFKNLISQNDILLCWDYSDLNFDIDFEKYNQIYLIAYSAGVFVAGLIKDKLPKINKKVAINGNIKMFDEYFGINRDALEIMHNLNLNNYMSFRRDYLVFNDNEFEYFNQNSSIRTFESCEQELNKLEQYYKLNNKVFFEYDSAILSDNDKIFNPERQKKYYKGKYKLLENHAHDIFAELKNLDEIIQM